MSLKPSFRLAELAEVRIEGSVLGNGQKLNAAELIWKANCIQGTRMPKLSSESLLSRAIDKIRRRFRFFMSDVKEKLTVRKSEFTEFNPPNRLKRMVGGEKGFKDLGEEFLRYFVDICGLKPNERILDVGCGVGRIACALTTYLNQEGSYEGFDIIPEAIDWDNKMITPKFPNFHFQLVDIYNKNYNPKGKYCAWEFKFPYEAESFDFVFLASVFTHMLPKDMEGYLSEVARVLKPNGRCLITFFLLNPESIKLIESKSGILDFQYQLEGYRTVSRKVPECAIAYDEATIRALYERYGLFITQPIHYGSWSGRKSYLSTQDIIVVVKKAKHN